MENEKNMEEGLEEVVPAAEPVPAEEAAPAEAPAEEAVTAEETPAEETAPAEAPVEEVTPAEASAEETPAEEPKAEEKKATPGKMALVIGAIVVVIAVIVALLMGGTGEIPPAAETAPALTEAPETVPVPTIPADGNPNDETCKGTYTVTDEEAVTNADTVVATIGEHTLTNGQLQAFYWMQVQSFLSSDWGSQMMYYGVLDYTQPLDMQVCALTGSGSWQQFFLKEALTTWRNYCALAEKSREAEMELSKEEQAFLDGIEENLQANAEYYGLESIEELLKHNIGPGAAVEDYIYFQELLMRGNLYYDAEVTKIDPTAEELETFYAEHEASYAESGITKEGKFVDVRHVLFVPEGGTTDETGATVYTEAEWAACEAKAREIMNVWSKGECDEGSFAAMAAAYSQDPGSKDVGGLYENVQQGQMVPEFDSWCFDEKRVPGHYGIVKTTYGYHLMYFVKSTPIWEYYARQDLVSQKTNELMEQLTEQYPIEVDYSAISLGLVNLGG